jgi:putative transposase
LPPRPKRGRSPTERREVIDAILYLLRAGCAWPLLPREFGPWSTIYDIFRRWVTSGLWKRLHDALHTRLRQAEGRQPAATAAVLDSQTVKLGTQGGPCGYDAGKKIAGHKRHVLVDRLGLLLGVLVGPADQQDRDGAKTLLERCLYWYGCLATIWADGGYAGALVDWVRQLRPSRPVDLEIVRRDPTQAGFTLLPKRWVVERTFAWFGKQRRLVRDYEAKTQHSEAMLRIAMSSLMLRRLPRHACN